MSTTGPRADARARLVRGGGRFVDECVRAPRGAVLFDRDGTLVDDLPGLRRAADLRPVPGARRAVAAARAAGFAVGLVTNQPVVASGHTTLSEVDALHAQLAARIGRLDVVAVCPHAEDAGCGCRKPAPGLVLRAAHALGLPTARCVVVGDIASDMEAAERAGAIGILVPNRRTRAREIADAPLVADDVLAAVRLACGILGTAG